MIREFSAHNYNMTFNTETGYMERWGNTKDEDPSMCPIGAEILDIEVSEQCHGINGKPCPFCYKGNVGDKGKNMSFETYKNIIDKFPKVLTQVAFGIGDIDANKDLYTMMHYTRSKNIIPNITINGDRMHTVDYDMLAELCGAVSVSFYGDSDVCFNAIKELTDRGMKQVNIHVMMSEQTVDWIYHIIDNVNKDKRLEKLNAVVFLALKQKGRGIGFSPLSNAEYKKLIVECFNKNIRFGFDSCGAHKFIKVAKELGHPELEVYAEPCESGCFSSYINVEGRYFPCSFAEDVTEGIDVVSCHDFMQEVWYGLSAVKERNRLLDNGRNCPYFDV